MLRIGGGRWGRWAETTWLTGLTGNGSVPSLCDWANPATCPTFLTCKVGLPISDGAAEAGVVQYGWCPCGPTPLGDGERAQGSGEEEWMPFPPPALG